MVTVPGQDARGVEREPLVATSALSTTSQIAQRCRAEPLVLDGVLADLCPALEQVILQRMERGRSTKSLNVGGWKSAEDFFDWPEAAVQELRKWVVAELGGRAPVGWAMVNRAGSHHPRHQHRAATITGIYYVNPGSEDAITPTVFECEGDPRNKASRFELEVDPHPGRLVICRGETWHRVPVYPGELPRITIAFDVRR